MKKILFVAVIFIAGFGKMNAQSSYGLTGGYYSFIEKISGSGFSLSGNASGFFVGFFGEFPVNKTVIIQPEIHFATAYSNSESLEQITLPVLVKYYIDDKISALAGPQLDYILTDIPGGKQLGIGLGLGLGYDFAKNFFAYTRYTFGFTNRVEEDFFNTKVKVNTAHVGIAYRF